MYHIKTLKTTYCLGTHYATKREDEDYNNYDGERQENRISQEHMYM